MLDTLLEVPAVRLAIAVGIGLMTGAERERRMAARGRRGPAGIRTFALVALLGGVLEQIGIYIIMAVSLNIATGYLGQLPLGHAGFMSVGGYSCALFIMKNMDKFGLTLATMSKVSPASVMPSHRRFPHRRKRPDAAADR